MKSTALKYLAFAAMYDGLGVMSGPLSIDLKKCKTSKPNYTKAQRTAIQKRRKKNKQARKQRKK